MGALGRGALVMSTTEPPPRGSDERVAGGGMRGLPLWITPQTSQSRTS